MKILHVTTDNRFVSHALDTFERVYPDSNRVWALRGVSEENLANNSFDRLFTRRESLSPKFISDLNKFDLVILHSFISHWEPLIILSSSKVKIAWLGWGYDYYRYIYEDIDDLLLGKTKELKHYLQNEKEHLSLKANVKLFIKNAIKSQALKKIDTFSPVLEIEHELIENAGLIPHLPTLKAWNYGSLEENLVENFIGKRVTGNSILVGNSASFPNNHLEVFEYIKNLELELPNTAEIITPLSYGDEAYKEVIVQKGKEELGDFFHPLLDYMSIDDYVELIRQCGFVIMNHKRQQALGNIVIMLYLGARVFLREENPVYIFLKAQGAVLNSISDLKATPSLIQTPLHESEIEKNISILYKHWSKLAIDEKTKSLVEHHSGAPK